MSMSMSMSMSTMMMDEAGVHEAPSAIYPLDASEPLGSSAAFEHRACADQIRIVEAFGEPLVERSQGGVCLVRPALRLIESRQCGCRAQREQQRPLVLSDLDRSTVRSLGSRRVTVELRQAGAQREARSCLGLLLGLLLCLLAGQHELGGLVPSPGVEQGFSCTRSQGG